MSVRVGINGFGRMGRLVLRAAWDWPELEFSHVNELHGDVESAAHLLTFDSIHGRWSEDVHGEGDALVVNGATVGYSRGAEPGDVPWGDLGVEVVLECSGRFRTRELLEPYFDRGVRKVIVAAPVKHDALNLVVGVNDDWYEPDRDHLLTAASCTTNCLAPVVKVIHEGIGIRHGLITTLHDMTNTQTLIDAPHKDLRRARAASLSLIPTTTGSATAIGLIFPELEGRLNGLAVRVPLLNASLTDCVFEVARPTTVDEVNRLLEAAASGPLAGILGYERRPLVSVDFRGDPRSGIVDALSTMVTDDTQVKILAWYDNEWGYVNRLAELARTVAAALPGNGGVTTQLPGGRRMASSTATPASSAAAPRRADLRNYALVTGAYWTDTLVDGAIRTLVLFYFDRLGYSPLQVASLFVFYEIAGIVTNLVGGWLAARLGLKVTLFMGLAIQVTALSMLGLAPKSLLVVPYVMASQALSGVAKDLNKMSSKSAVKLVVAENDQSSLYRWVAILTGSKNALKGVGFFFGGLLLTLFGFQAAVLALAALPLIALIVTSSMIRGHLGRPSKTAKFSQMFSNSRAVNMLAAARIFLFAARDVWFVVGLPFFLYSALGWSFWQVGTLLAVWVIGYGGVQAAAPRIVRRKGRGPDGEPDGRTAVWLALSVAACPAAMAVALSAGIDPTIAIVAGLIPFGALFAMNSAVHSYLILAYADNEKVAMSVGFYYMANACGRLAGTVLSGLLYQWHGLDACLWTSTAFLIAAALLSLLLPSKVATRNPGDVGIRARLA